MARRRIHDYISLSHSLSSWLNKKNRTLILCSLSSLSQHEEMSFFFLSSCFYGEVGKGDAATWRPTVGLQLFSPKRWMFRTEVTQYNEAKLRMLVSLAWKRLADLAFVTFDMLSSCLVMSVTVEINLMFTEESREEKGRKAWILFKHLLGESFNWKSSSYHH